MNRVAASLALVSAGSVLLLVAGGASAASAVEGTIWGSITSVDGSTFSVSTQLVSSGTAKVTVGSKTAVTEQETGSQSDLTTGVCVMASGTKNGSTLTAARITIAPSCTRPSGGHRPGQGGPAGGTPPSGHGDFTPPANFGFAFGTVGKVSGATLTVKGAQGSTTVEVDSKTRIAKTVKVGASALTPKLCAFVRGTSSNDGVTVQAEQVQLT